MKIRGNEVKIKSSANLKIIILLTLGIIFLFLPIITINLSFIVGNSDDFTLDQENLKISAVSGKIHIDDNDPSSNWSVAKDAGICAGNGTYSEPYVIEDLVIDAGGWGSCIFIENSSVYFKIENCSLSNSAGIYYPEIGSYYPHAAILLSYVNNSYIIDNEWSGNWYGLRIQYGDNNTISGNTANDRILIVGSGNTFSGNIMIGCGFGIYGSLEEVSSHNIDTTNLVNGKPLYYYVNEVVLGPDNFTNAGQVILVNCNDSLISNLNIVQSSNAISLHYCSNNTISGNTADLVTNAIMLRNSDNNLVSGNTANRGSYGIHLYKSNNNTVSGNTVNYDNLYGINLYDSNNNSVSGNTANFNNDGIDLYNSSGNTVTGNTLDDNTRYGMRYTESHYNIVSGNIASNNGYGIHLGNSDYNNIAGNTLIGNDECIVEDNCEGNIFENNDCDEGDGIFFEVIILISVISGGAVIVVTGILIRKRRASKDEVARYHKLKEQEKQSIEDSD